MAARKKKRAARRKTKRGKGTRRKNTVKAPQRKTRSSIVKPPQTE